MTTLDSLVDADVQSLITSVVAAHDCTDDRAFWKQLCELGLADLTGAEQRGGSGATWREAAHLARSLARHGCVLGVADSDLVAGWLLERCGVAAPQALRAVHLADGDDDAGHRPDPPLHADRVLLLRHNTIGDMGWFLMDCPVTDPHPGATTIDTHWTRVHDDDISRARLRLSLVRAVQITGALEAMAAMTVEHAQTREQFGRPIGRQQAVQQMVATVVAETALARAATDAAVLIAAEPDGATERLAPAVAVARSCTGHAVDAVVRNAHQVIGAIGTTREHRLHIFTSMALSLRGEHGTTRHWDDTVVDYLSRRTPLSELQFTQHDSSSSTERTPL